MDSVFGLVGADFVVTVADTAAARSIIVMKGDYDKIMQLDKFKLLARVGEPGDTDQFCEYVQKNVHLLELQRGFPLSMKETANFVRSELATAIRSQQSYMANLLLSGCDGDEPALYWIDYLGSMKKVKFGAHGYCSNFLLGLMDRYWKPDMTLGQTLEIIDRCIDELRKRYIIQQVDFTVKVADQEGTRQIRPEVPG